jgi:RHS repeat-associated protein
VAQYRYDSLNRISQIVDDDDTVSYSWDSCINGIGRLCSVSNANSSLSYRYDRHGRITGQTQSAGQAPLSVSHSYNNVGQRIQTVTPGGQTLDYQWSGGRLAALSVNGQPVLSQISYDPDGQVNGWLWGNNQPSERFYDLTGRPVIVSLGFDAQNQLPSSRTLGYDAAGRLTTAVDDSNPQLNQHHLYDELDRLIGSERGEPVQSRTNHNYDLSGNRTGKIQDNTAVTNGTIDANSNRLQSQSGAQAVNYSYEPAGSLTGDGTISYSYNAAGRRISATAPNLNASYTYNALGQRITKTVNGATRQFVYDEQGHLTGEYDSAGHLLQELVWLGDLPVAMLKPAAVTPDIYYIHADHLGTPRAITRPGDNKVVWTWESEAFGANLPEQNPSGLGNFVFNLRFPGQYYDVETGLHYNYFRDYDPQTGRYIESDPIGLQGGINTYTYVNGNPVNAIDSEGLSTIVLPWVEPILQIRPLPNSPAMPIDPVLPIPDIPGIPNNQKKDPSGEECRTLARRIANTRDEIFNKRYPDLEENPGLLPWRIGPGEKLKDTVRGHEKLLNRRLNELRKLEDEYAEKCVPLACATQ